MTYYETRRGAKVFAAGAFLLAKALPQRPVQRLLANLWRHLAGDELRERLPARALRGELLRLEQYPTPDVATDRERAAASRLRAGIRSAAAGLWREPAAARRNGGFGVQRPRRKPSDTVIRWYHAWHRGSHTDRSLDPKRPDTLVYADVPGHVLVLVGVMYYMPRGARGSTPGGPITRWHWHRDCAQGTKRLVKPKGDRTCAQGTRAVDTHEMMHVWLTRDLRSAFALHAPVPELCVAGLLPVKVCRNQHSHD